ncbi:MAG: hypothetical protein HYZ28_03510 [Myxococcales bacterium]|nr:hypothetical protein [Myxococcales bacterium]
MRRTALVGLLALAAPLVCCGPSSPRQYQDNDLELASVYAAKEVCSCVFVMKQPEAFCRAWTKANPSVASFRVDTQARTVESSALLLWGAKARFTGARSGCVLE